MGPGAARLYKVASSEIGSMGTISLQEQQLTLLAAPLQRVDSGMQVGQVFLQVGVLLP
jgi:hypothetical protein